MSSKVYETAEAALDGLTFDDMTVCRGKIVVLMCLFSVFIAFTAVAQNVAKAKGSEQEVAKEEKPTFGSIRTQVQTRIAFLPDDRYPLPKPPKNLFKKITYPSDVGNLGAFLSVDPKDNKKHSAIIWLTGGLSNTLDTVWGKVDKTNDQTASAYRDAGIIMMFPSLRGGNDNPGKVEGFVGEIDDILAAADYLVKQPYVDPERIYLGGHSTGGTLVLLTAAADKRFAATFAFGPVSSAASYGESLIPANFAKLPDWELYIRAPILWLSHVESPVFVIEGTDDGNIYDLQEMEKANTNENVTFIKVNEATHFSVLHPVNKLIAKKILAGGDISLTEKEVAKRVK